MSAFLYSQTDRVHFYRHLSLYDFVGSVTKTHFVTKSFCLHYATYCRSSLQISSVSPQACAWLWRPDTRRRISLESRTLLDEFQPHSEWRFHNLKKNRNSKPKLVNLGASEAPKLKRQLTFFPKFFIFIYFILSFCFCWGVV